MTMTRSASNHNGRGTRMPPLRANHRTPKANGTVLIREDYRGFGAVRALTLRCQTGTRTIATRMRPVDSPIQSPTTPKPHQKHSAYPTGRPMIQ